jgi:hypothetical protein
LLQTIIIFQNLLSIIMKLLVKILLLINQLNIEREILLPELPLVLSLFGVQILIRYIVFALLLGSVVELVEAGLHVGFLQVSGVGGRFVGRRFGRKQLVGVQARGVVRNGLAVQGLERLGGPSNLWGVLAFWVWGFKQMLLGT